MGITVIKVETDPDMPVGCVLVAPKPGTLPPDMPDSEVIKYFCLVVNIGEKPNTDQQLTTAIKDKQANGA